MTSGKIQLIGNDSPETKKIFFNNPSISFFKWVFKKHTNFAIENMNIPLEVQDIDKVQDTVIEIDIPNNIDLLSDMYLTFDIPDVYSGYTEGGNGILFTSISNNLVFNSDNDGINNEFTSSTQWNVAFHGNNDGTSSADASSVFTSYSAAVEKASKFILIPANSDILGVDANSLSIGDVNRVTFTDISNNDNSRTIIVTIVNLIVAQTTNIQTDGNDSPFSQTQLLSLNNDSITPKSLIIEYSDPIMNAGISLSPGDELLIQKQPIPDSKFKWIKDLGCNIVKEAELLIDNQVIDTLTGDWLRIWHDLYLSKNEKKNFNELTGNVNEMHTPELTQWYVNHPGTHDEL